MPPAVKGSKSDRDLGPVTESRSLRRISCGFRVGRVQVIDGVAAARYLPVFESALTLDAPSPHRPGLTPTP
ncbi:hypothetical protein GCM10018781_07240 [Kitasatospora indigofera]|uniref:Uncharacterized protein n=1 Tax=Kitasatospora indigofera TaxID=67307 RepID=A0A919KK30_9ACTN|nr:hypothetical protein GCM10018781_07240 [Kitasatospora indigofera]